MTLLGGAAAWPIAARAQQRALPVIGYLSGQSPNDYAAFVTAFRQGLNDTGYVEHRNVGIEYRWAEGQYDRLPAFAADLVRLQVSVIAATGATGSALAAKAATATIPIVFTTGGDPVKLGLVSSFNRPGGNVTGVSFLRRTRVETAGVAPRTGSGSHCNWPPRQPDQPKSQSEMSDVQAAARVLGLRLHVENASSEREIDAAFASFVQQRVNALFVAADAFFDARRDRLVALAARHALPAIYNPRGYVAAGGLMSYGPA